MARARRAAAWLLFGAAALCGGAGIQAQTTSAALDGTVQSAGGRPVEGAVVQARSELTGAVRSAVTDSDGRYRISHLAPGAWTVVARLADGGISESRSVTLRLQQTQDLDFSVRAGPTERVTVQAETPLIDPKQVGGSLRVGGSQAEGLPLSGRDFTDLSMLDASVRRAAPGDYFGERGAVFVVNGQSGRSNSFLVDGLDNNDQTSGTNLNAFFSQQVIQEFVLMTHQFSPEFGRASGGVLNVVTKRGGNEPFWGFFAQGTSSDWNEAGNFVTSLPARGVEQDAASRFQSGVSVGGPIRKDRAFYFAAYEHQDGDAVVPYTAITRDGVHGGRIIAPADNDSVFLRTDFNLGSSTSLMIRLSGDQRVNENVNVGGVFSPETGFRLEERDVQLAASLSWIPAPNLISETRLLLGTSRFDQFANSDRPGVSRPSGLFGGNNLNRQDRDEDRVQLVQNLTWRRDDHTLKFGVDLTRSQTYLHAAFNPNGNFLYNYDFPFRADCNRSARDVSDARDATRDAGQPWRGFVPCDSSPTTDPDDPAWVGNNIFSYPLAFTLINGEPEADLDDTRVALFAQDKWEIGERWLLDYGLRYDYSTFRLPADARVDSTVPNGGAPTDGDNLAPRFGFTFTPDGTSKLVLRGGAGLFYDKLVLAFPAVAAITSGTEIGFIFPQSLAFEITEETIEQFGIEVLRPNLLFLPELTLRFSTATELETPYTVQYNLGLDRAIGRRAAVSFNLVRALGYHMPLMKDLNPVGGFIPIGVDCRADNIVPGLTTELGLPCHLPDPANGSIVALVTEGRSWYTGIDLGWKWQRDDSWFSASYTLSKAEDLGFDPLKGGLSIPPSDDLARERARADHDRRHRFVVSGDLGLPWLGLRASGVLQVSSGVPFNVTTGQDGNTDGILTDRPAGVPRNAGEDVPLDLINAARASDEVTPLGPVGALKEPSMFQVDLRVSRPFVLRSGKARGELFLQVFNLLDRENAGVIEGRIFSESFGGTTALAGPPRTLEFGLRIGG